MMRICYFNSSWPPDVGGISTFNWNLARNMSLDKQIDCVRVVVLKSKQIGDENYSAKLMIRRLKERSFLRMGWQILKQVYYLKNFDIFHATNLFPVGFWLVLFGRIIFRKPVAITWHGTDALTKEGSLITKFLKYLTLKWATQTIAVSQSTLKKTADYYHINPSRFKAIYFGLSRLPEDLPKENIRVKYNLTDNDFIVLSIGRLVARKGVDDIIRAIGLISESKVKLLIVGDGPERNELENLIRELSLSNRVIFTGRVDNTADFYNSSDVFVLASKYIKKEGDIEGLGIVLLEAQQRGVAVIGSDSGGIPEAIANNQSGFVVSESSPEAIKEKILLLYNQPELKKAMGEYGRKFVMDKFSWERSVEEHIKVYKELMRL